MNQLDLDRSLIEATKRGQLSEIRKLISQGANPENELNGEASAVQWAAFNGDLSLIRFFCEELGLTSNYDCVLTCAEYCGHRRVMRYLSSIGYKG